ncbi:MAG: hypothetical protein ABI382_11320 [Nakamurella sp.]
MDSVEPDERSASEPPASEPPASEPRQVGPLDEMTVRPLRGLLTAKLVTMAVLAVAAIGAGVLMAPQVGTGLGLAPQVSATVTSIDPLPADETASGAQCTREHVNVTWGDGNSGSFVTCGVRDGAAVGVHGAPGADMRVAVGDRLEVHAVAGWQSVVVGSRTPNVIVAVILFAVLALVAVGSMRYVRERRVIAGLRRAPIVAQPLPATRIGFAMAFDVLSLGKGKGKRAMLQMRFDDDTLRPLRLQVPGASVEAMEWRTATVRPVGRSRDGGLAGPYVLQTSSGVLLAAGRRIKRRRESTAR